jgi:hypothetical protein
MEKLIQETDNKESVKTAPAMKIDYGATKGTLQPLISAKFDVIE